MKTTVVPAQVTTVEDRVAGNLGVSQLFLLTIPVFVGSALYVLLPPFFSYAVYKVVIILCLLVLALILAVRIKGKIVLQWLIIVIRYNLRPRYVVFDKNDSYLRDIKTPAETTETLAVTSLQESTTPSSTPLIAEIIQAEQTINNPEANLRIKINRKGKLSVHLSEVE